MERRNLLKAIPAAIAGLFGAKAVAAKPRHGLEYPFLRIHREGDVVETFKAKSLDGPWLKRCEWRIGDGPPRVPMIFSHLGPDWPNRTVDLT